MHSKILVFNLLVIFITLQFRQNTYCQVNLQQGLVITKTGDTIRGFIDYCNWEKNPDEISFCESVESLQIKYNPNSIGGFIVNNEVYLSAVVTAEISPIQTNELDFEPKILTRTDTSFVQVMFSGEKNLYFYRDKMGKQNFYIGQWPDFELLVYKKYLKEEKSGKFIAENKNFIGQLNIYLQDCKSLKTQTNSSEYNKRSLENLFKAYYECTSGMINYQYVNEKPRFDFGVIAGVSMTKLELYGGLETFNTFEEYDFPISWNMTAGLSLNIVLPRNRRRWSIYNELLVNSYRVSQHAELYINEDNYSMSDANIGYSYIKLNNMLRYNFEDTKDLSLFFNLGISNGYAFKKTNSVVEETKKDGNVETTEEPAVYYTQRYEQGFLAGIGLNIKKFSVEMRYEKGSGMTTDSRVSSTTRTHFLFGFRF